MATDNKAIKQILTKFWVWLGGQPTSLAPSATSAETNTPLVRDAEQASPPSVLGVDLRPAARYTYSQTKQLGPRHTIAVQEGDTLYDIANLTNVSVQALIQANGLTSPKIYIGQKLLLPENASPPPVRNTPIQTTSKKPALRVTQNPRVGPDPRPRAQGQLALELSAKKTTKSPTKPVKPIAGKPQSSSQETKKSHRPPQHKKQIVPKHPSVTPSVATAKSAPTLPRETQPVTSPPKVVTPPQKKSSTSTPPSAPSYMPPPTEATPTQLKQDLHTHPPQQEKPKSAPITRPHRVKPTPIKDNNVSRTQGSKPTSLPKTAAEKGQVSPTSQPVPSPANTDTFSRAALLKLSTPSPTDRADRQSVEKTKQAAKLIHNRHTGSSPTSLSNDPSEVIQKTVGEQPHDPVHFSQNDVQAMYITYHQLGNIQTLIELRAQLEDSRLNAVIIDIKNEYGSLSYQSQVPLAATLKANRRLVLDMPKLIAAFKHEGIYTIGRVVSFKDPLLASTLPELAAKQQHNSTTWFDTQGLAWADPFQAEVWQYNLDLAQEASGFGFDEILFDALRFPTSEASGNPRFSQTLSAESRLAAISGFLSTAKGILAPTSTKTGATLTNYACWRQDDNLVGHNIERLAPYLDVIAPIMYPSAFEKGIPGYTNPLLAIETVVQRSTQQAVERGQTVSLQCQIRPWLQDFQDDIFDKRIFGKTEIQAQINGAVRGGAAGFLIWNPQSSYTFSAYKNNL